MRHLAWPLSLRGQMIALVLIGLSITQILTFVFSRLQHQHRMIATRDENTLLRIASVAHLLAETPAEVHERICRAISSRVLQVTLTSAPVLETQTVSGQSTRLRQRLATLLDTDSTAIRVGVHAIDLHEAPWRPSWPGVSDSRVPPERRAPSPQPVSALAVAVRLGDGRWLNAVSPAPPPNSFWQWSMFLSLGVAALVLSGPMIVLVRRITRPLAHLALAAERFGRGEAALPLREHGPHDIQKTIRAFNHMRARLERFVQDRTHMLAAISHDLRTPLTALRERAELLEEGDTREKILALLDEMQCMTEATLVFVREGAAEEDTHWLDLDALVQSVCDDLSDLGQDVTFTGPGKTLYRGRSVSLKRALRNLVENAVAYGQRARVTLTAAPDMLGIAIDDDGPGIAAPDMARVFEPFVRVETSRSRDTGGLGLGMAIARSIVRGHGGEITLANRLEGGLRVSIQLPQDPTR